MPPVILLDSSAGAAHALCRQGMESLACSITEIASTAEIDRHIDASCSPLLVLPLPDSRQVLSVALTIRQKHHAIPLLLAVSCGSEELAVAAFRAGITDYFRLPGEEAALLSALQRLVHPGDHQVDPFQSASGADGFPFIGDSPPMHAVKLNLARIARSNSNVLITGETGTGKELVASAIHGMSARRNQPFVCVNCAAIPDALFESEWFGYERGAFTGAQFRTAGWMESSHHGTMFLDEIGDMSLFAQAKLLRVIESKEFHRLGGKANIRVDVRFIAATNCNLEEMAGSGKFRQDLYYRLNIARVHLPPLRDRKEDIPPLLRHYMRDLSLQNQNRVTGITDEVWNCLMEYDWPGNIRELKNVLESIFVTAPEGKISFADLPEQFRRRIEKSASPHQDERQQLITALMRTKWNKSKAAEELHWSRMTLYRKMHKYRIYTPRSA
jgi:DNA-binding NtrC family response regulator